MYRPNFYTTFLRFCTLAWDLNRADTHVVPQPGCLSRSIAGATLSMTRWPKKATTKRFMGKEKTLNADICQLAFSLSSGAAPSRPVTSLARPRSRWVCHPLISKTRARTLVAGLTFRQVCVIATRRLNNGLCEEKWVLFLFFSLFLVDEMLNVYLVPFGYLC